MEYQELLLKRRSIRSYDKDGKPEESDVRELIAAALEAPTWKNTETGRYYCILSEEQCEKFRRECLPAFNAERTVNASYIITTYVKNTAGFSNEGEPNNEVGNGWGCFDLGLQVENLLLKASECGFSTLVMGIRDADRIRSFLSIPEEEAVMAVLAVGQTSSYTARPKRKDVSEVLKFC